MQNTVNHFSKMMNHCLMYLKMHLQICTHFPVPEYYKNTNDPNPHSTQKLSDPTPNNP